MQTRLRGRVLRRLALAWLVSFTAAGLLGAAQAQAAAREHACCQEEPAQAAAPPAPCVSLLPLACCEATALPATPPQTPERAALAPLPSAAPAVLAACAPALAADAGRSPPVSPLRLSVVLRL